MELKEAIKKVERLGVSYFEDFVETDNIDRIIAKLVDHVSRSRITRDGLWDTRREALRIILQQSTDQELDVILRKNYGLWPQQVGGGRALLQRVHDAIAGAIEHNMREERRLLK